MASYDPKAAIPEVAIKAYIASQVFDPAKGYEQINNQYWVATFLDGNESVANFKRSGFPTLKSNPYPGSELKTEGLSEGFPILMVK